MNDIANKQPFNNLPQKKETILSYDGYLFVYVGNSQPFQEFLLT